MPGQQSGHLVTVSFHGHLVDDLGQLFLQKGIYLGDGHPGSALVLQQSFFRQSVAVRARGTMTEVYAIPEGRQASVRLFGAWGKMTARYPAWSAETRDSIYHHLCALDLF